MWGLKQNEPQLGNSVRSHQKSQVYNKANFHAHFIRALTIGIEHLCVHCTLYRPLRACMYVWPGAYYICVIPYAQYGTKRLTENDCSLVNEGALAARAVSALGPKAWPRLIPNITSARLRTDRQTHTHTHARINKWPGQPAENGASLFCMPGVYVYRYCI